MEKSSMTEVEINSLLEKYKQGDADAEEIAFLESWYIFYQEPGSNVLGMIPRKEAVDEVWTKIENEQFPQPLRIWRRIAVAAALFIALFTGLYLIGRDQQPQLESARIENTKEDIAPGTEGATLTLSDGRKISLSAAANGDVARQSGVTITKSAGGQLTYELLPTTPGTALQYNTLSTTKGEQYQIKLQDGTRIWLNSATSIRFPTSFAGLRKRELSLTGEAYFEVAKDHSRPFTVSVAGQQVKVLGTHFNISSYPDEALSKTTLLEGSVAIGGKVLQPGEQAVVKGNSISINVANIEETMGWRDGYIIFENEPIEAVMRKIARWYNVEVVFEGPMPEDDFGGRVPRLSNVSQVLKKLELTNKVHFKVEGRRITVIK
ncbi:putative anti-sigma factor [Pedobacter sp. BAL39]|uniref:FecR family protein n=1 Tax=Pedobacter sp. BAL39 TaxID=391596 RepID=UPI00015594E4|nr:FecR family protein [Pedobacter sp. BAL39]EDM37521.1 putative anti-sigma factor [Pedobacter sp. BAL39]